MFSVVPSWIQYQCFTFFFYLFKHVFVSSFQLGLLKAGHVKKIAVYRQIHLQGIYGYSKLCTVGGCFVNV